MGEKIEVQFPCVNGCMQDDEVTPRPAKHGKYCQRCFRGIEGALDLSARIVEHVVSLSASKGGGLSERVDGTGEPPMPWNTQAVQDANETYQRLVYWSIYWADKLGVQAPGPAKHAWRARTGFVVGLPSRIRPADARYVTGVMASWLKMHLDRICGLDPDEVRYFADEMRDVYRIAARWPMEDKPSYSDMPCVDEDCKGRIAVHPPQAFKDDQRIVCEKCGRWYEPDRYEWLIRVYKERVKQQRAQERQVSQTVRHLVEKYGIGA